ncbi:MAG: glycoside hydrolase family 99-like domain-containing protein [Kiritimatiellia bacterium]
MKHIATFAAISLAASSLLAAPLWTGDALRDWTVGAHQIKTVTVEGAKLKAVCSGTDGHLYSSTFKIPAKAGQEVVFRAKGDRGGRGELFWMRPGEGAKQKLSIGFEWIGDGAWHEYRLRPYWQGEKTIGRLRLDFPASAHDGGAFEIERLEIVDGADTIAVDVTDRVGVTFSLVAETNALAEVLWAGDGESGVQKETVRVPGDGRRHRYFLGLFGRRAWKGTIGLMRVETPAGVAAPTDLTFVAEEPDLPADLVVKGARMADAFNRVGSPVPLTILVENLGTRTAKNVRLVPTALPDDVRIDAAASRLPRDVPGCESTTFSVVLSCAAPRAFTARFEFRCDGHPAVPVEVPVSVLPSLNLPKAAYVPEPKPVETDYDIAALYFPGWSKVQAWERVWKVCPERRPVLGWYDEANPECVDWQIKWLVENGIRTLYVDWYWHKGSQHHDHWVKAFYKAKYRRHLKWAMMWANHNPPGSHSVEDQRAATKFWIENYFNTPEYLRIDDKPVVWIWNAQNMDRDVPDGGCRRLLDVSREMARAAGFKGIYFIAMKWPEADCAPKTIQYYKDVGFDMTGIYHFMSHGGRCDSNRRFPYSAVADANPANWWKQQEAKDILPFLPNLSTGWDDRPWNDGCEIYGKNVADFRRICRAAKTFADATGVKRLCLAPLNEWGEGSYAEPNTEHGFGFYEAVRETFCRKPASGWPLNYGPKDVGLGPYDLPPPAPPARATAWDFTDAGEHGWRPLMNITDFAATPQGLSFKSTSYDPAIVCNFAPLEARSFTRVVVKMKVTGPATSAQLFWAPPAGEPREGASIVRPLVCDGEFHEYVFPVAKNRAWRARVNHFRFDPVGVKDAQVVIASIRLEQDN